MLPTKEETLAGRLSEAQSFLLQCSVLANRSLVAIGFPVTPDSAKRTESITLTGKVNEMRSDLLELRNKLETIKNALE